VADSLFAGNREDGILLDGNGGNDDLTGGAGSDLLAGGLGNDLYVYIRGDGADMVSDTGGLDTLAFGDGIELSDLDAEFSGNDLVLGLRDRGAMAGPTRIRRAALRCAKVSRCGTANVA
jgi:Ca2+-binding RTX toxin-like protein